MCELLQNKVKSFSIYVSKKFVSFFPAENDYAVFDCFGPGSLASLWPWQPNDKN